jgi:phenylpyruvate tautomerase PptA (4-oxalocrotonate tautomerase family)
VEVESRQGGKLRLELKGIATSQLAELIRAVCNILSMLAMTPQMRILVAVEAVDFRKYAPSIDMRSFLQTVSPRLNPDWAETQYPHVGLSIT